MTAEMTAKRDDRWDIPLASETRVFTSWDSLAGDHEVGKLIKGVKGNWVFVVLPQQDFLHQGAITVGLQNVDTGKIDSTYYLLMPASLENDDKQGGNKIPESVDLKTCGPKALATVGGIIENIRGVQRTPVIFEPFPDKSIDS